MRRPNFTLNQIAWAAMCFCQEQSLSYRGRVLGDRLARGAEQSSATG